VKNSSSISRGRAWSKLATHSCCANEKKVIAYKQNGSAPQMCAPLAYGIAERKERERNNQEPRLT
jgi:hypothetical protein